MFLFFKNPAGLSIGGTAWLSKAIRSSPGTDSLLFQFLQGPRARGTTHGISNGRSRPVTLSATQSGMEICRELWDSKLQQWGEFTPRTSIANYGYLSHLVESDGDIDGDLMGCPPLHWESKVEMENLH